MFKWLLILLPVLIAGCDLNELSSAKTKWAVVDMHKMLTVIRELELAKSNMPSKDSESATYQSLSELRSQISKIEKLSNSKCEQLAKNDNDVASNSSSDVEDGRIIRFDSLSAPKVRSREIENNPEYISCTMKIKDDQLLADLKAKATGIEKALASLRENKENLNKRVNEVIKEAITTYGKFTDMDLIITQNNNGIVFNKEKVITDVTDAVLEHYRLSNSGSK